MISQLTLYVSGKAGNVKNLRLGYLNVENSQVKPQFIIGIWHDKVYVVVGQERQVTNRFFLPISRFIANSCFCRPMAWFNGRQFSGHLGTDINLIQFILTTKYIGNFYRNQKRRALQAILEESRLGNLPKIVVEFFSQMAPKQKAFLAHCRHFVNY